MTARLMLLLAVFCTVLGRVEAVDLKARSVSSSKQFTVYCEDVVLRGRVTGFVEEVKADMLGLLGASDHWKLPIVITLSRAPTPASVPVKVQLFSTPEGMTVQIEAQIGDDPAAIHLQKHVLRALLLEFTYRHRHAVKGGEHYAQPPWWLVEGSIQIFRQRDLGISSGLFQSLIRTNRLPPIEDFLKLSDDNLGDAARAIDGACAMGLVRLLLDQPGGRENLGRLLQHWPEMNADPVAALLKDFPALGTSATGLQKWWTLNLARYSAVERYKGLSTDETEKELAAMLRFEVADKSGKKKSFGVRQFAEFTKLAGSKATMNATHASILALSIRANALYRPILADYEQIFALLARGKTRGIEVRLENVDRYHEALQNRIVAIADYLNWYEATQITTESGAFDSFLKAANEASAEQKEPRVNEAISRYLDELEKEF